MFSASIVADSISEDGHRITTFQLRYPRFIHAEFMTHRVFSRNASSSRAIPTARLIEEVLESTKRASPIHWGRNQPGMQANEELGEVEQRIAEGHWASAARDAAHWAQRLMAVGAHKQIVNRVLEPFLHINVVVTSTEWANFFGLRCHPDAQPEIKLLAELMRAVYEDGKPVLLKPGQWHLPYCPDVHGKQCTIDDDAIKVSVARCARVSYKAFDGTPTKIEDDLKLYERLVGSQPMHASPAEHQATPDIRMKRPHYLGVIEDWARPSLHGNFNGWVQYRQTIPGHTIRA